MPRNMSFSMTEEAIRSRLKTVTRRMGWTFLVPGEELNAVRKCMGLKRGEKVERLDRIRVVTMWREPLNLVTPTESALEGLPHLTPAGLVERVLHRERVHARHAGNADRFRVHRGGHQCLTKKESP